MQSDLVGAHAMGLRNVLLTTGKPAPQASYADATSVFDVDAIGLTNMVARLNQGLDIGGQPIGAADAVSRRRRRSIRSRPIPTPSGGGWTTRSTPGPSSS